MEDGHTREEEKVHPGAMEVMEEAKGKEKDNGEEDTKEEEKEGKAPRRLRRTNLEKQYS